MGTKSTEHEVKPEESCFIHAKAERDQVFHTGSHSCGLHDTMSSHDCHSEAEGAMQNRVKQGSCVCREE